ncbi:hypothetical protein HOLleu_43476 [Holothuria leucospilota]|uniref:C2H2-type domain-containing protein n=1 Tax=Holothuria leucospilota TaxID=206669 RepID=A0A9Q0Y9J3_HOLLE|nr:hypothetical protein HOLleu_43476 [Holothuria leucospilota]
MKFQCCQCIFSTQNFLKLLKHYRYLHNGPGSTITCNIEGCYRTFNSVRTFQRHINKKHSEFWAQYGIQREIDEYEIDIPGLGDDAMEDENVADFGDGVEHGAGEVDPAKHVAAFLIGIRERFKIPHEACNFVASEVRDIIELSTSHLTARVISALQIANVDPAAVNLDDVVNDHSWQNSFDYYSDARHLNAFIAEKFDFVEPVEYVLGRGVNGKDRCMQYVSIIDTLKALLRKDEVFAEVLNGHCSQDGLILDFCDGLHCKSNASLSEHQSLQIQLYSDDFCVANPLGNKVKKLKFSAY